MCGTCRGANHSLKSRTLFLKILLLHEIPLKITRNPFALKKISYALIGSETPLGTCYITFSPLLCLNEIEFD